MSSSSNSNNLTDKMPKEINDLANTIKNKIDENKSLSNAKDKVTSVVSSNEFKYYADQGFHAVRFLSDQSVKMFLGRHHDISDNINKFCFLTSFVLAWKTNSLFKRFHVFSILRIPFSFVLFGASMTVIRKSIDNFNESIGPKVEEATEKAKKEASHLKDKASEYSEKAKNEASHLKEKASEYTDKAKSKANDVRSILEHKFEANDSKNSSVKSNEKDNYGKRH